MESCQSSSLSNRVTPIFSAGLHELPRTPFSLSDQVWYLRVLSYLEWVAAKPSGDSESGRVRPADGSVEMATKVAFRRSAWLPLLLVGAAAAVFVIWREMRTGREPRTSVAMPQDTSLVCSRPEISLEERVLGDPAERTYMPSVRNVSDPSAANYCSPTDPRWGVLGRFTGDTTITLEQGRYCVSARLIGRPGEPLMVIWGDRSYPIIAVYGGGVRWKQRYITLYDDHHYMLPIQWDEHRAAWEPYGLERWADEHGPHTPSIETSLEGRCSHCHEEKGFRAASEPLFIGTEGKL